MKFLIGLALLVGGVVAALAYLPPETTGKIGTKAAVVAIRGCKGAKKFVEEFQAQIADDKASKGSDAPSEPTE